MDKVAAVAGRERRGREMNRRGTGRGMDKVVAAAAAAAAGRERRGREMKQERERERNG